ncbi:caspase family protein [Pseudotabrizicola sp. L79]|uniref:caspase family protein n=1 Tax=Pseudotabrizicola sp. L79 TaxID=3118402 RepID=UPI002F9355A6
MRLLLATIILVLASAMTGFAQQRHALIVGNDIYTNVPHLQKARNDANAVSQTLGQLGFRVTTLLDADRTSMNRGLATFASAIQPGDEAVFYFAGHGIEVAGRNYLLPVDIPAARPGEEDYVVGESIAVDRVLQTMQQKGARVSLLILDACRDNPFPVSGTRSLGTKRGLAQSEPPEGVFILFSAGTGQSALDRLSNSDTNPNSVFTRALLPRLSEPGLIVSQLAIAVRQDVREMARSVQHDQFPAYYDQLTGVFSFNADGTINRGAAPLEASVGVAVPQLAPAPIADPCDAARADWQVLQSTQSQAAFEAFARKYADCPIYAAIAQERLTGLATAAAPPVQQTTPVPAAVGGDICSQLWYARNLIFHQKGYCFTSAQAKSVFDTSQCSTSNPVLSASESAEVDRIKALEKANGC